MTEDFLLLLKGTLTDLSGLVKGFVGNVPPVLDATPIASVQPTDTRTVEEMKQDTTPKTERPVDTVHGQKHPAPPYGIQDTDHNKWKSPGQIYLDASGS